MGKGYQHDAKMDAEIHDFFECFQKRRKLNNYWFFNRKVVQTMQKGINNRSKIDAKSKPERRVPKGAKMSQKGAKIDAKIHPKFKKGAKGEPRGRQQSQKGRKKGMPKTRVQKEEKLSQKVLARRNARGQSQNSIRI